MSRIVSQWLKSEANRRGIPVAGLIRAIVEGCARKKEGGSHPIFLSKPTEGGGVGPVLAT